MGAQKCGFRMRHPSKVEFWGAPRSKHSQLLKKETPFFRVRSKLSIIFSSEKLTFEAKCVTVVVVFGRDLIFSSEKQPRSQLLKDVPCQMHIFTTQNSPNQPLRGHGGALLKANEEIGSRPPQTAPTARNDHSPHQLPSCRVRLRG